jgi:hypothetical protein
MNYVGIDVSSKSFVHAIDRKKEKNSYTAASSLKKRLQTKVSVCRHLAMGSGK